MSDSKIAVKLQDVSKCFQIYNKPHHRLMQGLFKGRKQYFNEFWALKDISFEIKKGETVGIIGRNGSGKSTLLQIICGTLASTSGNVEVNGRVAALLELGAGFNSEFTGRENVYMNAAILGLTQAEIDAKYDEIVVFADIGDFIEQPVKTYSSGMFVRLAFAIQANIDPEILIVDEALAVGDAYFVHRCMLRFNELQKAGTTILFVSHDANAVRNLCPRAIWLVDGSIKEEGDSSTVVGAYLAELFGHKTVIADSTLTQNTKELNEDTLTHLQMETSIPNIDRRLGDQKCKIIGVGLYDELLNRITSSLNDKVITLRLTILNQSLDLDSLLAVGYIIRNAKGQEIASTNSHAEEQIIKLSSSQNHLTVQIKIILPCLHPGSYAFTVTVGYIEQSEEIIVSDWIENAIVLDVVSSKHVYAMMKFPTTIEVES